MRKLKSVDLIVTIAAVGIFFFMFGFWSAYFIFV